jgi:hypothetical protein
VNNFNTSNAASTAVGLNVASGHAPFTVNSAVKVANLNADMLDGLDSNALQRRVSGTCSSGQAIQAIGATGTVTCQSTRSGIGAGVMTGRLNALSAALVSGGPPVGTSTSTSASVGTYQTVSPSVDLVAKDFMFRLSVSPGTGASRDMEFVVGSGATVMCTISGSATSCTAPGPVSLPAGTSFSLQTEPHGSPAAADLSFGYLLTTP